MSGHAPYHNVTLETIDRAVFEWFDRTVAVHVMHPNKELKKVQVNMAAGERWIESRTRKAFRDKNGVLILPIISIRRTGIDNEPSMSALGSTLPTLTLSKRVEEKTNNLRNLYKNRDPQFRGPDAPIVYEVTSIPFPSRKVVNYEIQIQAQYITQMNTILEKMFSRLDILNSFVAPFENDGKPPESGIQFELRTPMKGGYVVGFIEGSSSDQGNMEEFTDQERIVKFQTTIRVPAVLQIDADGEKSPIRIERTSFRLGFGKEDVRFVDDPAELDKIFGKR